MYVFQVLKLRSLVTDDPAVHAYSDTPVTIVLNKENIGVGLSISGGYGCSFGDRPIVVKKIFASIYFFLNTKFDVSSRPSS